MIDTMDENYQSYAINNDMIDRVKVFLSECQGKKDSVYIVNSAGCFDTWDDMTEFITECDRQGATEHIIDVLNDAQQETEWCGDLVDY